jgi:hypothetical protein
VSRKRTDSKTGRNDPCPCGSGRKYKHCHLLQEPALASPTPAVLTDRTSVRCVELIQQRRAQFDSEYKRVAEQLRRVFVRDIGAGLDGPQAAKALEDFLGRIETAIAEIAARRSRLFWVHLARRIPPVPIEHSSPWTTNLYRTVLSLALLRYGSSNDTASDFKVDYEASSIYPRSLTYEDCRDIYELEYLAFEYNAAATSYRRVGKGAILRPIPPDHFAAIATDELEWLMDLVDRRTERYSSIFSPYGSAIDISGSALKDQPQLARTLVPFAALNVAQQDMPDEVQSSLKIANAIASLKFNYLLAVLDADATDNTLLPFADQLTHILGVSPRQILVFLSAVGLRELGGMSRNPAQAMQFVQRAYWITKAGPHLNLALDEIAEFYGTIWADRWAIEIDAETARREVEAIFKALTYTDEKIERISLWDKEPYRLVLRHGDLILWDYSNIPSFIAGLLAEMAFHSGNVGNIKGTNFEEEVLALIRDTDAVELWEARSDLVAPDGTQRQVDASFVSGNTLYVVECKAYSANRRVGRGDWSALQNRWERLTDDLDQARTMARFLEVHPRGKAYPGGVPYQVPEQVTRIEYCVCTPFTEFIPKGAQEYWFDAETPRICMPKELMEFVKGDGPRLMPPRPATFR